MTRHGRRTAPLGAFLALAILAAPAHALTPKPHAARITHGPHAGRIVVTFPAVHDPAPDGRTERVRITVRDHRGKRIASTVRTYPVHPSERITAPHRIVLTRAQSRQAGNARHLRVSIDIGDHTSRRARVTRLDATQFTPPAPFYKGSNQNWAQVVFFIHASGGQYSLTNISARAGNEVLGGGVTGANPLTITDTGYTWSGQVRFLRDNTTPLTPVATSGSIGPDGASGQASWDEGLSVPSFSGTIAASTTP